MFLCAADNSFDDSEAGVYKFVGQGFIFWQVSVPVFDDGKAGFESK